jgi:uncharacterized membrane-anchored protein
MMWPSREQTEAAMIGFVEAPRAWWLANGMARAVGVNLPRAVFDGVVKRSELAAMVGRCQSCGKSDACMGWLSKAVPDPHPPAWCCIGEEIEALSPRS